tara:strand:- start:3747 stop:4094 length:348 start_codon:yes stop_codon:yes gene_type:complete
MTKANFTNGDRISFYHLQPIPRKDNKLSWIDDRPLSIYGWKRITGEVQQSHNSHNRLWVSCDDRAYTMTILNENVVFEEEAEGAERYIYLDDVEKGHPLYFGGGCILPDRTPKTV